MPPSTAAAAAKRYQQKQQQQQAATKGNAGNAATTAKGGNAKAGPSRLPALSRDDDGMSTTTDTSDSEEEEEEQALQMDGQDLWNQNYCSVCDCLIEPGQGVGPFNKPTAVPSTIAEDPTIPPTPLSTTSSASSGLKSSSGTIKARPTSSEGAPPKRNSSSGRLHAVGSGAALGPTKRNGSAGSRLNALSDLKPTTKLYADKGPNANANNNGAATAAKNSKQLSRRPSGASVKSNSTSASDPDTSPANSTSNLPPRTRKGGLLGALTPALLKQQEEELNLAKAPAALYCSERCRQIDQEIPSAGLAELSLYVSAQPPAAAMWSTSPNWSPDSPFNPRVWPRTASMTSVPAASAAVASAASAYGIKTPESEYAPCACPDCMEKNSASGTVPSGASDTTESSNGFPNGRYGGPAYRKQRSKSGRIITPQNLLPPHGGDDGYFPRVPMDPSNRRQQSMSSTSNGAPERTSSAASGETGRSGTDSSTQSTGSYASFWEPRLKAKDVSFAANSRQAETDNSTHTRTSTTSNQSMATTQGTVTPAAANSIPVVATLASRNGSNGSNGSSDAPRPSYNNRNSIASTSIGAGTSPLQLIRRGDLRTTPSVDISANQARSPPGSRPFSASFTSEHTLGTSAKTLVHGGGDSALRDRRQAKGRSLIFELPEEPSLSASREAADDGAVPQLSKSYAGSSGDALSTLRAAASSRASRRGSAGQEENRSSNDRRLSAASANNSSSWLKSLSSAWSTLRTGASGPGPPTLIVPEDDRSASSRRSSVGRTSSTSTESSSKAISASNSADRSSVTSGSDANSGLSRSAASESLARMLSGAAEEPRTTSVARPGANRGSVPAFAKEIGHGQIPGECDRGVSRSPPSPPIQDGLLSTSVGSAGLNAQVASTAHEDERERRRRRRAEHRHQRSKDITVLPPLLAPNHRAASSTNLANRTSSYVNLAQQQRNRSKSRSSVGNGATFTVGSVGSIHDPSRPMTPAVAAARMRGARSPEPMYAAGATDAVDEVAPLPRVSSQQEMFRAGTSPRRAGLGWGALTPLNQQNGALAAHLQQQQQRVPHHRHSHHPHHSQAARNGYTLGHVGMLGHHPHGSQPTYGRHNTMPVRTSTPIVPEHGGEMSGAALTGEADAAYQHYYHQHHADGGVDRPRSAIGHRRGTYASHHSSLSMQPPQRPRSSMALRPVAASPPSAAVHGTRLPPPILEQGHGNISHENLAASRMQQLRGQASVPAPAPVRSYPVLQLPDREETHDRYDDAWSNAMELIAGPEGVKYAQEQRERRNSLKAAAAAAGHPGVMAAKRKQLFHFGP